jgi:hypothetical protein
MTGHASTAAPAAPRADGARSAHHTAYWVATAVVALAFVAPGLPRLKEWAYAGMIFDLSGAAASRFAVGDGVVNVTIPLVIASVVAVSWTLRPEGRTLARSTTASGR